MAATLVKKVMLRIAADDGDTEEKLDKISAKADDLGRKHPDLKVKIDTAAAAAKLAVLKRELKDTTRDEKDTGDASARLSDRLRALGGSAGSLTAVDSGMKDAADSGSKFKMALAGLNIATGLGEPLMAGLLVTTGALSAGLVSAGAGLGVFGLVAKSVYSQASTAVSSFETAQNTTGKAAATAMGQYKAEMAALPPSQRAVARSIIGMQNAWQGFVQSNTAGVGKIISQGMGLIPRILATMQPFLAPTEHALSGIISSLGKGIDSSGFKSFMDVMAKNTGPMITDIAHAIGNVIAGIGGILKAFMPATHQIFGGLDSLTAKFAHWGQTLTGHSGFKDLMSMFKSETPLAVSALKSLAGIAKQVVSSMTGLDTFSNSKMLLQLAVPILKFVNALLKAHPELVWLVLYLKLAFDGGKKLKVAFEGISGAFGALKTGKKALTDLKAGFSDAETAASDASGVWGTFGGKISGAVTAIKGWSVWSKIAGAATKVWTGIQAAFDAVMDANPIALIVIGIALLVAAIVVCTIKFKAFRDFWKDAWKVVKSVAGDVWHFLVGVFKDIVKANENAWNDVKHVVSDVWHWAGDFIRTEVQGVKNILSWFGRLGSLFRGWWDDAVNAVVSVVGRMLSFVRGIPGKIISGLANLGSMLFSAGAHAMSGLISGIGSMVGTAISKVESWGHDIANAITHPFGIHFSEPSQATQMIKAGRNIALGLGTGMDGGNSAVRASAARLAAAAGISGAAAAGGAAGAGQWMEARVSVDTSDPLMRVMWEQMKLMIRIHGGGGVYSVQKALGQRWPAGA